jgi:hypothetical protein
VIALEVGMRGVCGGDDDVQDEDPLLSLISGYSPCSLWLLTSQSKPRRNIPPPAAISVQESSQSYPATTCSPLTPTRVLNNIESKDLWSEGNINCGERNIQCGGNDYVEFSSGDNCHGIINSCMFIDLNSSISCCGDIGLRGIACGEFCLGNRSGVVKDLLRSRS